MAIETGLSVVIKLVDRGSAGIDAFNRRLGEIRFNAGGVRGALDGLEGKLRSMDIALKASAERWQMISKYSGMIGKGMMVGGGLVLGAVGGGIAASIGSITGAGAALYELHERTGLSVAGLSDLDFVARATGADLTDVARATIYLQRNVSTNSAAFKRLGMDVRDVTTGAVLPAEQLFWRAIGTLRGVANQTDRTSLALGMFGRGAMSLLPILNMTDAEFTKLRQEASRTKGWTEEGARSAHEFETGMLALKTAGSVLLREALLPLVPTITAVVTGITEYVVAGGKWASRNQAVIVSGLTTTVMLGGIAVAVGALVAALPTLITSLTILGGLLGGGALAGAGALGGGLLALAGIAYIAGQAIAMVGGTLSIKQQYEAAAKELTPEEKRRVQQWRATARTPEQKRAIGKEISDEGLPAVLKKYVGIDWEPGRPARERAKTLQGAAEGVATTGADAETLKAQTDGLKQQRDALVKSKGAMADIVGMTGAITAAMDEERAGQVALIASYDEQIGKLDALGATKEAAIMRTQRARAANELARIDTEKETAAANDQAVAIERVAAAFDLVSGGMDTYAKVLDSMGVSRQSPMMQYALQMQEQTGAQRARAGLLAGNLGEYYKGWQEQVAARKGMMGPAAALMGTGLDAGSVLAPWQFPLNQGARMTLGGGADAMAYLRGQGGNMIWNGSVVINKPLGTPEEITQAVNVGIRQAMGGARYGLAS